MKHIRYVNVFLIMAILILLALIVTSSLSLAVTSSSHWTGTFSSMEKNPDSGDITGWEIRIVGSAQGYSGTIQFSNAWPGDLLMLEDIRYDVGDILFKLASGPMAGSFRGRITDVAITGILETADYKFVRLHLPRKPSFWD